MENKADESLSANNITPNFENLSDGTLRRYQAFYNIRDTDGSIAKDRNRLVELIKEHFNNMEIDNEKVIQNCLRIEKDITNEKNNCIRKSLRFQEKTMSKFLDSFK